MAKGSLTRRVFIAGSAVVTGGVVFGVYSLSKPFPNPLIKDLGPDEATITPYIKFTAEGITVITPRVDKGQGAYSVQLAMIAEELDVDMAEVLVDPGLPDPAYYNTALSAELAPYKSFDKSSSAQRARDALGVLGKVLALQMTGGSSTVPDVFERFRRVGAVARETFKEAVSLKNEFLVKSFRLEMGWWFYPMVQSLSILTLSTM